MQRLRYFDHVALRARVGQARLLPGLLPGQRQGSPVFGSRVRPRVRAAHGVACYLSRLDPASFRVDLRQSVDALQQASGQPVVGYRAPTFSVTRQTAWELGIAPEALTRATRQ